MRTIDRLFPVGRLVVRDGDSIRRGRDGFLVELPSGRRQRVELLREGRAYRLSSRVAGPDTVRRLGVPHLAGKLLLWNRETPVVAFGLGEDRSVIAWVSQVAETLQQEELLFYVAELAHEADRVERVLTGEDHW